MKGQLRIGNQKVSSTLTVEDVTQQNIEAYKAEDIHDAVKQGFDLPTDEEYVATENYLQSVYKSIMEDEDNE